MKLIKRLASLLLAVLVAVSAPVSLPVSAAPVDESDIQFVELSGDWHFKNYRTYSRMFQYLPYNMVSVTWEDNETALLPDKEVFSQWETVSMPYSGGDAGGLLPLTRDNGENFMPTWSESWVCRTFDLPADFSSEETVTLLMGIIDDCDVIYINGHLVAGSGFMDENSTPILNSSEIGGFSYFGEKQYRFEKSYWEVEREYSIPTSILNQGGENEICIRLYNNNGNGGFYAGRSYALCNNDLAVRAAKGLPTQDASSDAFRKVIEDQIRAIENNDIEAFADTVSEKYVNDMDSKANRVAEVKAMLENCSSISVTDVDPGYYQADGIYWYNAKRTITAVKNGETVTLLNEEIEVAYTNENGIYKEYGNHSHCYTASYDSSLFNQKLKYSIYLPKSYYTRTNRNYPVVYLLHGINSSSSSFVNVDGIESFMNDLIASGKTMEMIVVMPDSGKNSFYNDTAYDQTKHDSTGPWRSQIIELVDFIDANYRTINDPGQRGITGISMGGGGSMDIGCGYTDYFSSVASHMGYLPESKQETLRALTDEQLADYDFYIDCGLQDVMVDYNNTVEVHEYLNSKGKEHGYDLRDGGHNSAFYMASMDDSMIMHSNHFLSNTEAVEYPVTAGASSVWKQNSDTGVIIGAEDAGFDLLEAVYLDGQLLDSSCYAVDIEKSAVELLPEYLITLKKGEHTVSLSFSKKGSAKTRIHISPKQSNKPNKAVK